MRTGREPLAVRLALSTSVKAYAAVQVRAVFVSLRPIRTFEKQRL